MQHIQRIYTRETKSNRQFFSGFVEIPLAGGCGGNDLYTKQESSNQLLKVLESQIKCY